MPDPDDGGEGPCNEVGKVLMPFQESPFAMREDAKEDGSGFCPAFSGPLSFLRQPCWNDHQRFTLLFHYVKIL